VPPTRRDAETFLYFIEAMGKQGIRVLAHPMRIFDRAGWPAPPELFEPTAKLLRRYGVAAEINFHSNAKPHLDFIRCCLDNGACFSFGSDSHNLSEIGDFARHISLLRDAGFDGDLSSVVLGSWQ
jgi:histidinol phosphatase-like PHP family hydrolase